MKAQAVLLSALLLATPPALAAEMPEVPANPGTCAPGAPNPSLPDGGTLDTVERVEWSRCDPARQGAGEAESSLLLVSAAILVIVLLLL